MKIKLKPCPFCGTEISKVNVGTMSSDSRGVRCHLCGAKIEIYTPDEYPKECNTLEELDEYCLKEAVARWNRRANEKNI